MTDIVERLRWSMVRIDYEAADEIERLRAERDAAVKVRAEAIKRMKAAEAGRDRLREALEGVMNSHGEQLHDAFAVANAILKEMGHE